VDSFTVKTRLKRKTISTFLPSRRGNLYTIHVYLPLQLVF
jgi:hypothetical protein